MPDIPKNEYHLHHAIDVSSLTKEQLIGLCQTYIDTAVAMERERDAAAAQRDDTHRKWLDICQRYERVGQKAGAAGGAAFDTAEERVNWLIEDRNRWRLAAQSDETQKAALDAAATSLSATGAQLKTVTAERDAAVAERDRTAAQRDRALALRDRAIQDRDALIAAFVPAAPAPSHSLRLNAPTTMVGTTPHPQHPTPDPDYLKLPGAVVHWYRCKNEQCRRWVSAQFNVGNGAPPGKEDTYVADLNLHVKYCPMCGHNHRDKDPS
jgi:hypothetical protein